MKGVLVVAPGRLWVGPNKSAKMMYMEMMEVRTISSITIINASGTTTGLTVDEIMVAPQLPLTDLNIAGLVKGEGVGSLVVVHAATPLIPTVVIEKCAEAIRDGQYDVVQTCLRHWSASDTVNGSQAIWPRCQASYTPVAGVRAFLPARADREPRAFLPIEVTKKQGLSLLDEVDRELIASLEHAGQI